MRFLNRFLQITAVSIFLCLGVSPSEAIAKEPLASHLDAKLQQNLELQIRKNKKWRALVNQQKMGICLVDLNGEKPRFANVNGDKMMYAASLPKIAILLAAYVSFEDGSLKETPELHKELAAMIRVSSNTAATRMIDLIGFEKIHSVLQDPKYRFYDKTNAGGLWVGKRYASEGPRKGDPLFNISHGATANQVCRFFYHLAAGKLINTFRSEQMLTDLGNPKLHHKFVSQTDKRAPLASVFRKSGSWRRWHADAIFVRGVNWRNYILVGLVESKKGEQIIRNLLPIAEDLIEPTAAQ